MHLFTFSKFKFKSTEIPRSGVADVGLLRGQGRVHRPVHREIAEAERMCGDKNMQDDPDVCEERRLVPPTGR